MQDILSDIPGYMEDMLTLQTLKFDDQGVSFDQLAKSLRLRATVSIEQLCALRWQWEDQYPDACYEVVARRGSTLCVYDDTGEPIYPTLLSFRSVARALEITTFNTMFLILYRVLSMTEADELSVRTDREAVPPYPDTGTRSPAYGPIRLRPYTNPLILPDQWNSHMDLVHEICRTIDYCLNGKHESLGACSLMFPLGVVYARLLHDQKIRRLIERTCRHIAESSGFEIGTYVLNQVDMKSSLLA